MLSADILRMSSDNLNERMRTMASVKSKHFMRVVRDVWFANGKKLCNFWEELPKVDRDRLREASGNHELTERMYEYKADYLYETNRSKEVANFRW